MIPDRKSIIHRSVGCIVTNEVPTIKRMTKDSPDLFKNKGFNTPSNLPYVPIGKMTDMKVIYDEVKKRFHLPIKDPNQKLDQDKEEVILPRDYVDQFYTQRNIDPEEMIQTRIWTQMEEHTKFKKKYFDFMLKKKKQNKSLAELLKKKAKDAPVEKGQDPKQAENNPYGLKNEKPKELYKHSVKSLKKSVSQSNHRVQQLRGGQIISEVLEKESISPTSRSVKSTRVSPSPQKKKAQFFMKESYPQTERGQLNMRDSYDPQQRTSDIFSSTILSSGNKMARTHAQNFSSPSKKVPPLNIPQQIPQLDSVKFSHRQAKSFQSQMSEKSNKVSLGSARKSQAHSPSKAKQNFYNFNDPNLRNSYESHAEQTTEANTEGDVFMTEPNDHRRSSHQVMGYKGSLIDLPTEFSANDKVPFINVPGLTLAMKLTEKERVKKPVTNPHIKQQKAPLKYRLMQTIEDIEVKKRLRSKVFKLKALQSSSSVGSPLKLGAIKESGGIPLASRIQKLGIGSSATPKSDPKTPLTPKKSKISIKSQNEPITPKSPKTPKGKKESRSLAKDLNNVLKEEEKQPLISSILSKKRISFMKTVKVIVQKNLIVKNFQEELDKRKERAIRKLNAAQNKYIDKKNEKNKELDYKVTSVELNRKALTQVKIKNLEKTLDRNHSTVEDFFKVNLKAEQEIMHDNVPGDLKWYTALIEELSFNNYCMNRGIFIFFDSLKFFLERGVGIDWTVFTEILDNIDKQHFQNRTLQYIIKKVAKSINKTTDELVEYFDSRNIYNTKKLFDIV